MTRPLGPAADGWTLDIAAARSACGAVHAVANARLAPDGARQLAHRLVVGAVAADAV